MKILHGIPSLRQPGLVNILTSRRGRGGMKIHSTQTGAGENNTKLYFRKEVLKMKKLKKNGGFTLVEMLIVVAIIAVLIAVSIPLINSSLEKARHAVDDANLRDAEAVINVYYLEHQGESSFTPDGTYVYGVNNYNQGTVWKSTDTAPTGYTPVKSSCSGSGTADCKTKHYKTGGVELNLVVDGTGKVTSTTWDPAA